MAKSKNIRKKGKLYLSRYFQEFKEGEKVAVDKEISLETNFPDRLQGRTGRIIGKRGRTYFVEIKDIEKIKRFLIHPIHLKKISS